MEKRKRFRPDSTTATILVVCGALFGTLLAVPRTPGPSDDPVDVSNDARASEEILAVLKSLEDEGDRAAAVRALGRLDEAGLEQLVDAVLFRQVGTTQLSDEEVEVVRETLQTWNLGELVEVVQRRAKDSGQADLVVTSLELLGDVVDSRYFTSLGVVASRADDPTRIESAFVAALVESLARDERAYGLLRDVYSRSESELKPAVIQAAGASQDARAMEFLVELLGSGGEVDADALKVLSKLAPLATPPPDEAIARPVRRYLGSTTATEVQQAVLILGFLGDEDSIPEMIPLLASDSRGIRGQTGRALQRITGLSFGESSGRWQSWYDDELAWFDESWHAELEALRSESEVTVLEAIRNLSRHRLNRHETARALTFLLDDPSSTVRSHACRTLAELGSAVALPALEASLEDPDATVVESARFAIAEITR